MGRRRQVSDREISVAAREVFIDRGPKAPVAMVAKKLGVSTATLFQRTGSKQALMLMAFQPEGTTAVTELDRSLWVTMTPGGLIGAGEFGPSDLIDPRTLQYVAVLPPRAGQTGPAIDVSWSPDYKWASRGQAFGHGGYCG